MAHELSVWLFANRKLQAAFIDNAVVARIVALLEQRCALTQQRLKESNGS